MMNNVEKTNVIALQEAIENIAETLINNYFSEAKINQNDLFKIVESVSQRIIIEKF